MRSELDDLLCNTFLGFFAEVRSTDCGDGWFSIIWEAAKELDALGLKAVQIKEKFGTLRIYLERQPLAADPIIERAERRSAVECKRCGAAAEMRRDGGWSRTHCERHSQ